MFHILVWSVPPQLFPVVGEGAPLQVVLVCTYIGRRSWWQLASDRFPRSLAIPQTRIDISSGNLHGAWCICFGGRFAVRGVAIASCIVHQPAHGREACFACQLSSWETRWIFLLCVLAVASSGISDEVDGSVQRAGRVFTSGVVTHVEPEAQHIFAALKVPLRRRCVECTLDSARSRVLAASRHM